MAAVDGLQFPLLSDFNKEVSSAYDVLFEDLLGFKGVAKRSAFVINEAGTIIYAESSDDPHATARLRRDQGRTAGLTRIATAATADLRHHHTLLTHRVDRLLHRAIELIIPTTVTTEMYHAHSALPPTQQPPCAIDMSDPKQPTFLVSAYSDPIVIQIHGKANYLNCSNFREFMEKMVADGKSLLFTRFRVL